MEIISYIQDERRQKFSWPVFEKRNHYKSDAVSYTFSPTEIHSFSVSNVKNAFSIRHVFTYIGHGISVVFEFLKHNIRYSLITLGSILLLGGAITGGFYYYNYKQNFTGPLQFKSDDTLDIENLNKMMEAFALEGTIETDANGKLLDATVIPSKINYSQPVTYQNYKVRNGDTISGIAKKFGLTNISTIISVNDIGNARTLAAGQKLKIPSMDGIIYTVKAGDSIDSIVKKYGIRMNQLLDVNELTTATLTKGQQLFLPGAAMDQKALKEVLGDKFIMPIQAKFRWSSPYGKRIDPIANVSSFHTGTDMACPTGTPIVAAMSGRVSTTGINRVYGNYVIIDHGNGYQTLYAHMSKIIATKGQWVSQGTRIGLVGSTGYSTGPHLHFTVYKNGQMINPMTVLK